MEEEYLPAGWILRDEKASGQVLLFHAGTYMEEEYLPAGWILREKEEDAQSEEEYLPAGWILREEEERSPVGIVFKNKQKFLLYVF